MVNQAVVALLLVIGVSLCHSTPLVLDEEDYSLHDDILYTPEQRQEMKERGFFTPGKWPKRNGVVRIPYYFDMISFPVGDKVRGMFEVAAAVYYRKTCIDWFEVDKFDDGPKVKIMKGKSCNSYVGMLNRNEQEMSLGTGCHTVGIILHEMGHAAGLFHTQSRPDRDEYVKIWLGNIAKGYEFNYQKSTGDTFGIPYDYSSVMHYPSDYFSTNGSFTMTTTNPFAIFTIGNRQGDLRYADEALINIGYSCVADNIAKCGDKQCQNGGFVNKDCTCRCPENTSGSKCETVKGPFFDEKPACGGVVTTERDLAPNGYPSSPSKDKCIFNVQAPKCKLPTFTFTEANFNWNLCTGNILALEVSDESFGYTWCDHSKVPLQKTIVSETQNANLYYSTMIGGKANIGFKARVQFVDDPNCDPNGSTRSTTKRTTTTTTTITTTTTTTTTTIPPSTLPPTKECVLQETDSKNFVFQTGGFPNTVLPGTNCSLSRMAQSKNDLIFTKIDIDYQGALADSIMLGDGMFTTGYGSASKFTTYLVWPLTFKYSAVSNNGKGFRLTASPVTGLPSPCNGEEITLADNESRNITNPLLGYGTPNVRCAFKITAPTGKNLYIRPVENKVVGWEALKISAYLPHYDQYNHAGLWNFTSWGNTAKVYYAGAERYNKWTIEFTVVTKEVPSS